MTSRSLMIYGGVFVLGIVLTAIGWFLTPGSSFGFPGPIDVAGQSLIALGLTFVIVGVALLRAGFEERMAGMTD